MGRAKVSPVDNVENHSPFVYLSVVFLLGGIFRHVWILHRWKTVQSIVFFARMTSEGNVITNIGSKRYIVKCDFYYFLNFCF